MWNSLGAVAARPFGGTFGRRIVVMALVICAAGVPLLPTNEEKVRATLWLAGTLLLLGAYVSLRSGERLGRTALDIPALSFLAIAVLATIVGADPRLSALPNSTRGEGLADYFVYVPAALAAARMTRTEVREILAVLLGAAAVVGAIGVVQYYGYDATVWLGSRGLNYGIHSWSTLANPDFLGGYGALVLPVGVAMAAAAPLPRQWWGYAGASILVFAALLASQTRSAWAATALAAAILLWRLPRAARVYRRLAALALAFAAVTAIMIVTQPGISLTGRAESALNPSDSSMQGKIWIWEHVLPMIRQRPVLGWGFSAVLGHIPGLGTPSYYAVFGHQAVFIDVAHNEILQVAVNVGLLGLAAYLWIWATALGGLLRAGTPGSPVRGEAAGLLAGLVAYFVWMLFLWNHIGDANVFWVLIGLAVAVNRAAVPAAADHLAIPVDAAAEAVPGEVAPVAP
jgi:O-antigen ligase